LHGGSIFITGQATLHTGLSKVGIPAAPAGLQARDATIAELLKPLGYATGQFGKNHLGDRNVYLPTVHGFDEFYGNLYHRNAEKDPENWFYPRDVQFRQKFGPRGVLRCKASDRDDPTEQPRWAASASRPSLRGRAHGARLAARTQVDRSRSSRMAKCRASGLFERPSRHWINTKCPDWKLDNA
jgi:arylsulfatase A-like enzyme